MNEDVSLREVMRQEFVGVAESDTVSGTLSLLADEQEECAIVLRGGTAVGIVTPIDLYTGVGSTEGDATPVSAVMRDPPPTLGPTDRLAAATTFLIEADSSRVLITEDEEVIGIVDARDILAVEASRPENPPIDTDLQETDVAQANYSSQSICEGCGSLSRDLSEFNGQLLCPDCRAV